MTAEQKKFPPLPDPAGFYLEAPLYARYAVPLPKDPPNEFRGGGPPSSAPKSELDKLCEWPGPLEAVCLKCQRWSVFHNDGHERPLSLTVAKAFKCTRSASHRLLFLLQAEMWDPPPYVLSVMKIGQQPSLADLAQAAIGQYRKPLGETLYADFNRGVGLAAHGVGAGSFVYLRRVFEELLREAEREGGLEAAGKRIEERIEAAAAHLPTFLVKNKEIYGILSTGIHELTEEECLTHFPIVRTGIELILDERIEQKAREKKLAEAEKQIGKLHEELSRQKTEQ